MTSSVPQLLVQFSDTHIKEPGRLAYAKADTAAGLSRAVEWVNRQRHAPKAVVITGDLTDGGRPAQYAHLRELLSPLRCPYFLMPGNHDNRHVRGSAVRLTHVLNSLTRLACSGHFRECAAVLQLHRSTPLRLRCSASTICNNQR